MNPDLMSFLYRTFLKPIFFNINPEAIHDYFTDVAKFLGSTSATRKMTSIIFNYQDEVLEKEVFGIKFKNPVGLSAGYDFNGYFVKVMPSVGFGFSTVGSTTNIPYGGNPRPLYTRLPKSKSILVNKGYMSDGAEALAKRLNDPYLKDVVFGIGVAGSNSPSINTLSAAIEDYLECFKKIEKSPYVKYYELNVVTPNVDVANEIMTKEGITQVLTEIKKLNLTRPVFLKLPSELEMDRAESIVETATSLGYRGFIFSNLIRDRENPAFDKNEIQSVVGLKGAFSGKPTQDGSNRQIQYFRQKFGKDIVIIGSGGIFNGEDAQRKLDMGADLVQLITGMIFEGPQLIGQINRHLAKMLK